MQRRQFLALAAAGAVSRIQAQIVPETFTLAATGDCILTRRVSALKHPGFLRVVELLRSADCLYGNCEMTIASHDEGGYPMPEGNALAVVTDPEMARELAWMGFDIMGTANNHTWDYGQPGIAQTRKHLHNAGIACTGSGLDLQQAAAPAYADTPAGRIALINCASTFTAYAPAWPSRGDFKGIPGLNPVRLRTRYELDSASFDAAGKALGPLGASVNGENLNVFGNTIARGAKSGAVTEVLPEDLARITDAVKQARRNARIVIVSIHAHETGGNLDTPHPFLQPFARAVLDAGADAFFGAGSHVTWGIEVYKGKPICYGLGDFFFQYETIPGFASDVYAAYGLDPLTAELTQATDKIPLPHDAALWQTVVPLIHYDAKGAVRMELNPVTLGMNEPRYQRGTPRMAEGEEAREILDHVARLSKPYGTEVTGNGVVTLR